MFKVSLFGRRQVHTQRYVQRPMVPFNGKLIRFDTPISHETKLFRDKIIENLPRYLKEKYPNGARIICHACSGGHEAYSLAAKFIEVLGSASEAKKLFPIEACDIDESIISFCKEGSIILSDGLSDWKTSYPFEKAFTNPQDLDVQNSASAEVFYPFKGLKLFKYEVGKELRSMVNFSSGNVLDEVDKLNPESTKPIIFMFRNAWFALTADERYSLSSKLYQNLPMDSLVVNGDSEVECEYEHSGSVPEDLMYSGFTLLRDEEIKFHNLKWYQSSPFRGFLFEKKLINRANLTVPF